MPLLAVLQRSFVGRLVALVDCSATTRHIYASISGNCCQVAASVDLGAKLKKVQVTSVNPMIEVTYLRPEVQPSDGGRCLSYGFSASYMDGLDAPLSWVCQDGPKEREADAGKVSPRL